MSKKQNNAFMGGEKLRVVAFLVAILLIYASLFNTSEKAFAFSGKKGSVYTVTSGDVIRYGEGEGGYSNSKLTDLDDGLGMRYSYCVQPSRLTPTATRVTVDKVVTDEADTGKWNALRNIIYYSPSYPGYEDNIRDVKSRYYTGDFSKDWGISHLALSYVYEGRPEDLNTFGNTKASDLGDIWEKAKKLGNAMWKDGTNNDEAVPADFKVFISFMDGVQDMVVGYLEGPGEFLIKKTGTLSSITSGNDLYSLKGAEYSVYDSNDHKVGELVIGDDGKSNKIELPSGRYTLKETKAPKGYAKDKKSYSFSVESEETSRLDVEDIPITCRIGLLLKKKPKGYNEEHGEGDGSLKNAVYKVEYFDDLNGANNAQPALKTWYFLTDEKGEIKGNNLRLSSEYTSSKLYKNGDGETVFPLGRYEITEVKASKGYILDSKKYTMKVTEDGTGEPYTTLYNSSESLEQIKRGGVKIKKIDRDMDKGTSQGDATLKGAEFTITNESAESVIVDGKQARPGEEVMVIKTDEKGFFESAKDILPYGRYSIRETKASEGYLVNEEWSVTFEIREDNEIVDLEKNRVSERVMRGGIRVVKKDRELGTSEAMEGSSLEGITMVIRNVSDNDIVVRSNLENSDAIDWDKTKLEEGIESGTLRIVHPNEDVGSLTISWDEERKEYAAETLPDDLPYGSYTIREAKTNNSYQRTDLTEHEFEVRENGKVYTEEDFGDLLVFNDQVYRSDVQGTKISDQTSDRFSFVPFKITAMTSGETHVVVTDKNGFFSTKDRRTLDEMNEEEGKDGTRKINPFDDLLDAEHIGIDELRERYGDIRMGVWFGKGEFGTESSPDASLGALPHDTYILEEMRCERNEGYTLQKFQFTVDEKSTNGVIDLETITDDLVEIGTVASVNGINSEVEADENIKLIDTIEYSGLKKGEKYVVKGRLIDRTTGKVVIDAKGREITAEKEFTAVDSKGKIQVEFTFDGSELEGADTVVFEKVFDSEGRLTAKHEDINSDFQRIRWEKPKEPEKPDNPDKPKEPEKDKPQVKKTPDKPETPKAEKPEKPKHDHKKAKVPKTGDGTPLGLWLMVLALSLTAAIKVGYGFDRRS